jgi:mRNA interferase RelE/StbE
MASYQIEWQHSAAKELKRLPSEVLPRIILAVENLGTNPFPVGVRKLVGVENTYRIREGDYRIVYKVNSKRLVILLCRVRHRKDVYQ